MLALSIFVSENNEELFDHRHLLKAVKENSYSQVPVATYERKFVGDKILTVCLILQFLH